MEISRPEGLEPAHKLTLELDNDGYTDEKYALYLKYQNIIHSESKSENTVTQFTRFLCSSPFLGEKTYTDKTTGESRRTGSYHQLYRIDGKLVAFAVLDLLPNTLSSVYFVYDPDAVGKFGMGKVSALREVSMCIEGGYKYYGLGIATFLKVLMAGLFASGCEKLRYKGEMQPSELLDPVRCLKFLADFRNHIYGIHSRNINPFSIKDRHTSHSRWKVLG
jgi:arginyl-tRNA---protein transferase